MRWVGNGARAAHASGGVVSQRVDTVQTTDTRERRQEEQSITVKKKNIFQMTFSLLLSKLPCLSLIKVIW